MNKTKKNIRFKNKKHRGGNKSLTKRSKSKCSPGNDDNNFSCFTKKALINIINSWNKYNSNNKIKYSRNERVSELWKKIDNKLKNRCNNEWCWIEQEFIRNLDVNELFRPKMPKKWYEHPREWLTTSDIENVMKQYEKKYKDFKFIGPVPIDFDYKPSPGYCIVNELCNINMKHLYNKGIKKLGVIFNLDPHDQPGSHWVALFNDVDKGGVYYFDSYGVEPPNEVKVLMERLTNQGRSLNNKMNKYVNNVRHQFKNSECGVYSMNFIVNLLQGKSFDDVTKNIVKDDDMLQKRNEFYIKH